MPKVKMLNVDPTKLERCLKERGLYEKLGYVSVMIGLDSNRSLKKALNPSEARLSQKNMDRLTDKFAIKYEDIEPDKNETENEQGKAETIERTLFNYSETDATKELIEVIKSLAQSVETLNKTLERRQQID